MPKTNNYPPKEVVTGDYAYRHNVMLQLKKPNRHICGYCLQQAVTEQDIQHKPDCPGKEPRKEE